MSAAAEGIVTVKVDILPSERRDFFEKRQCFGVFLVVGYLSIDKRGLHQPVKRMAARILVKNLVDLLMSRYFAPV